MLQVGYLNLQKIQEFMFNHIMKSINVIDDDFTNTLWLTTAVPSVYQQMLFLRNNQLLGQGGHTDRVLSLTFSKGMFLLGMAAC